MYGQPFVQTRAFQSLQLQSVAAPRSKVRRGRAAARRRRCRAHRRVRTAAGETALCLEFITLLLLAPHNGLMSHRARVPMPLLLRFGGDVIVTADAARIPGQMLLADVRFHRHAIREYLQAIRIGAIELPLGGGGRSRVRPSTVPAMPLQIVFACVLFAARRARVHWEWLRACGHRIVVQMNVAARLGGRHVFGHDEERLQQTARRRHGGWEALIT